MRKDPFKSYKAIIAIIATLFLLISFIMAIAILSAVRASRQNADAIEPSATSAISDPVWIAEHSDTREIVRTLHETNSIDARGHYKAPIISHISETEEAATVSATPLSERSVTASRSQRNIEPQIKDDSGEKYIVTAYCSCEICCGVWSKAHSSRVNDERYIQKTASGTIPVAGVTCGADWRVLPSGTVIDIETVGARVVEDTGAGIKGKTLDLYMATHEEALSFGRQPLNVKVVVQMKQ